MRGESKRGRWGRAGAALGSIFALGCVFWPVSGCARKEASAPPAIASARVARTSLRATEPTEPLHAAAATKESNERAEAVDEEPVATPAPTAPRVYKTVLSVGDSFNGAFSLGLQRKFLAEGARFVRDVWVGVSVGRFDRDARFATLLTRNDPDLVLISLGANDVSSRNLEAAARSVRSIVKKIGARDCYWIAPAMWKRDTGIVATLEQNVAPCRFYASRGFKVERRGDGWHPSVKGGAEWAERFWEFFNAQRSPTAISAPQGTSML